MWGASSFLGSTGPRAAACLGNSPLGPLQTGPLAAACRHLSEPSPRARRARGTVAPIQDSRRLGPRVTFFSQRDVGHQVMSNTVFLGEPAAQRERHAWFLRKPQAAARGALPFSPSPKPCRTPVHTIFLRLRGPITCSTRFGEWPWDSPEYPFKRDASGSCTGPGEFFTSRPQTQQSGRLAIDCSAGRHHSR